MFTYKDYLEYSKKTIFNSRIEDETEEYKINIHQPQDKTYKKILGDKEQAVKFINEALKIKGSKNELKENEIEKYSSSFITKQLKAQESDIVYKKKGEDIFFLIEHQSRVDYSMPYRIVNYCIEIIRSYINEKKIKRKKYKFPVVYPIVLYTGEKEWNAKQYLEETQCKMKGVEEKPFTFYHLIDVHRYTEEELLEEHTFLFEILLLEKIKTKEDKEKYLEKIIDSKLKEEEKEFLIFILKNMLDNKISKETVEEFQEKIKKKESENEMSALERYLGELVKQGVEVGREEGKEEGKRMGEKVKARKIAQKMLRNKMKEEEIILITEISEEELKQLKKEMEIAKR